MFKTDWWKLGSQIYSYKTFCFTSFHFILHDIITPRILILPLLNLCQSLSPLDPCFTNQTFLRLCWHFCVCGWPPALDMQVAYHITNAQSHTCCNAEHSIVCSQCRNWTSPLRSPRHCIIRNEEGHWYYSLDQYTMHGNRDNELIRAVWA